jgi:hypothetical protein
VPSDSCALEVLITKPRSGSATASETILSQRWPDEAARGAGKNLSEI